MLAPASLIGRQPSARAGLAVEETGPYLASVARPGIARGKSAPGALRHVTSRLADFCLSAELEPDATSQIAHLLSTRNRLRKGDALFRLGSGFHALFAIWTGSCKTSLLTGDGHEQVAGYYMMGEIVGMDGIGTGTHECQAAALEDMEVCRLPFDRVEHLARVSEPFRRNLHRLLSREGVRAQNRLLVLGSMRAEQRLATFLLDLSKRHGARGFSSCEFVLRMTRDEIGSYLGLSLETVSRVLSRFQRGGLIQVQGRAVKLLDGVAVSRMADCSD
jgi:CRP/FNR family transcriptional regulator